MMTLEQTIRPKQEELFNLLCQMYGDKAEFLKDQYILVDGEAPIMLVAHLDTVHKEPVKDLCISGDGNILMSPQGVGGDDRCGVYALNTIYERSPVKPWLLFTCDEECGGLGADAFTKDYHFGYLPRGLDELKMLVEIDRKGEDDAVYYSCANEKFEDYITSKGFTTAYGSFSDISTIAPSLGVAAVNLSSGYYNAHTLYEYIDRKQLNGTIDKVLSMVEDAAKPEFPAYEYIKGKASYSYNWHSSYGWDGYERDDDLTDIPAEIRDEYEALLDYYDRDELEDIRKNFGDKWIVDLFESEFGGTYDEVFYGVNDWGQEPRIK